MEDKYSAEINKMKRENDMFNFIKKVFERLNNDEFKVSLNKWLNQQSREYIKVFNEVIGYLYLENIGIKIMKRYSMGNIIDVDNEICYNCAASFNQILRKIDPDDEPVFVIWFEKGENRYPREPDIPPSIYVECIGCYKEHESKKSD